MPKIHKVSKDKGVYIRSDKAVAVDKEMHTRYITVKVATVTATGIFHRNKPKNITLLDLMEELPFPKDECGSLPFTASESADCSSSNYDEKPTAQESEQTADAIFEVETSHNGDKYSQGHPMRLISVEFRGETYNLLDPSRQLRLFDQAHEQVQKTIHGSSAAKKIRTQGNTSETFLALHEYGLTNPHSTTGKTFARYPFLSLLPAAKSCINNGNSPVIDPMIMSQENAAKPVQSPDIATP